MPSSSGGGSHSGGSHSSSGSSRSSYSSGGGSHSGGYSSGSSRSSGYSGSSYSRSSGSSYSGSRRTYGSFSKHDTAWNPKSQLQSSPSTVRPTVSEKQFVGAQRYVYYRDNKPQYIYSNYKSFKPEVKIKAFLIWWIFIAFLSLGFYEMFQPPGKLATDYDTRIVIEDGAGVIDDRIKLNQSLAAFLDKTGVTPAVVTLSNEGWNNYFTSLENKAFDLYVNSFEDEKHWLIVYSKPEQPDPAFVDWYWEGIQGDETVNIITEKMADEFGVRLQKYLTADSRYTVGQAFAKAFDEITPLMMTERQTADEDIIAAGAVILLMIIASLWHSHILRLLFARRRPKDLPKDIQPVVQGDKEITCAYCGGAYLTSALKCPHCGGPKTVKA